MASVLPPLAIYAASDQQRATGVLQAIGNIASVSVQASDLSQQVQSVGGLQQKIDASDPIVLIVSTQSASSPLFQSIALYAQQNAKRLIVIDLDNAGQENIVGNLKNFGNSVIGASDPEIEKILGGPDRWTLPNGSAYPETDIDYQKKC